VVDASSGAFPIWTVAGEKRRAHMARVAALLGEWARTRGESEWETIRWVAAGHLHDALRDEDPRRLRGTVGPPFQDLPGKVLHGPGAAERLRAEGVNDQEFLHAIAFHTLGSADFGNLGFALFAADFLEPGRRISEDWRAGLRQKAPEELEEVVQEILAARIGYLLDKGRPLRPETLGMWNRLSEGQPWASASEL
jgi:HD superfamily phosphohydrolase YqeK